MDTVYPWSILGIAPTVDEKAIRKAYALKLRETRPDENPTGFQMLVEARDAALAGYIDLDADDHAEMEVLQDLGSATVEPVPEREAEPDATEPVEDSAESDDVLTANPALTRLSQSLQELSPVQSWSELRTQWGRVFDAFDDVSLEHHWFAMHQMLHRLVDDMQEVAGEIPRAADMTRAEFTNFRNGPFGAYIDVLRDLDAHFQLSHHDTTVFDFLAPEDGFYLIEALSIALRNSIAGGGEDITPSDVPFIPESYVEAGFIADAAMLQYYRTSANRRSYASGFSLPVAFLSLPFTLYFRLHRLSALLAGIAAIIGILSTKASQFQALAIIAYLLTSIAIASQWRRLRVGALNARIDRLVEKGLTHDQIVARLKTLSRRDVFVMNACGLIVLLCWVGLTYGRNACRFQGYCR